MRIRQFLRLRKQNDAVKFWCIFVCVAIVCLIRAGDYGIQAYREVNTPIEYQVTGANRTGRTNSNVWDQVPELLAVSTVTQEEMTIRYKGKEISQSYRALSKEYLQKVYGITQQEGETCFYLNEAAYQELSAAFAEQEVALSKGTESGLELQYRPMAQEDEKMGDYRKAKFIVVRNGWLSDTAQIVTAISGVETGEDQVVAFTKGDLTGTQRQRISKAGGTVEEEETVLQREYEIKEDVLRVKYELVVGILAGIAAIVFWHYGVRK